MEELLGAPADSDLVAKVSEATEGNPFFIRELLGALLETGGVLLGEGGVFRATGPLALSDDLLQAGDLPEAIRQAVEARLERLQDRPRRVLEAASVLGRRLTERDLEALLPPAGTDPEDDSAIELDLTLDTLELALDTLIDLGLLEEERTSRRGDRLRFASGLVRDVVYRNLPRRRRRRLHLRQADALRRRSGKRLDRVAHQLLHHYAEAGVADEAIRFGRIYAHRSLETYSWDDALYACAVALEFVPDEDELGDEFDDAVVRRADDEADLRHLRARALAAKGLLQEAMIEGRRALERRLEAENQAEDEAEDDVGTAAEVALFLAETAWRARRVDDTRTWLDRGLDLAPQANQAAVPTRAALLRLSATVRSLAGEVEAAQSLLAEAARLEADLEDESPAPSIPPGGTLHLAMTRSVTSLDPIEAFSTQDAEIASLLFEPLLRRDSDGAFQPCLGPSWSRTDDGFVYRFGIDPERRFHDGTAVTADLVRRSLEESARLGEDRRPAALDAIEQIEAPSDEELVIRLRQPLAPFPALLADPRTSVALRASEASTVHGTGPFRLEERSAERWVLARDEHHPLPSRLDGVDIEFFDSSHHVADAWRKGGIHGAFDLARDLSPTDVVDFLRHGDVGRLVETPQNNVYFILLNPRGPALRDPQLRRIVATSVDAREIVWRVVPRFANPLAGWLPPGIAGHDAGRQAEHLTREEAIQKMDAFRPLPVRLRAIEHPSFTDQYRPVSDALCAAWHLLGIDVERRRVDIGSFSQALQDTDDFDLVFVRWWPDYPDPDGFFFGTFHSAAGLFRQVLAPNELDHEGLDPGELDQAIDEARREGDPAERSRLYRNLEEMLLRRHLVRPLFHDIEYRLVSQRVVGLETRPTPPFVIYRDLGLRKESPSAAVERRAGSLVVPLGSRVDTLDPTWSFHADAAEVTANIFEPLTRLDEAAVAVPHLADRMVPEDGGRRWLVSLAEARFHDGRRLSARDVRYSFQRLLRSGSPDLRQFLAPLEGAREAMEGRGDLPGVRLVGDLELELRLSRPMPHFPALLSNAATGIVPEGTEQFGPTWRHGTAGTGPFQLVGFQPGRRVDLVAYGDYRTPGLPKVAELVFEMGIDPKRAADGFTSGQFSMLSTLAADDLESFSRQPEFAAGLVEQPAFTTYFATLTAIRGPLADPEVRNRVADLLARLRPRLAQRLGRLGQPAGRLIPPSLLGLSDPAADATQGEPTAADPSLEGVALKVALHPSYGAGFRRLWREIRGALETAGLRLEPTQADFQEILQLTSRGELDLVFNRWIADYPDPSSFTQVIATGPASGQWNEPELASLAHRAVVESDRDQRRSLYLEFERFLADRAFLVPLFHEQSWRLVRPGISGLRLRYGWPEVVYEELKIRG